MKMDFQRGISLIEIILSVALIGFIVLAVNNVPNSIRLIGSSQKESTAKDIASKQIEQFRLKGYDSLVNGTSPVTDSRLSSLSQSSGNAIITDCVAPICNNSEYTKQVVVSVTWTDDGKVKKVQLNTFISKGGLQ